MALSFAFGGDTGTTYDDLKRRQSIAQALWARGGQGTPKTAMEGLNSAAQSITGALLAKKLGRQIKGEQDKFGLLFNGALGGFGGQPMGGAGTATPYVAEDQYKREAFPLGQTGPAPERNTETVGGKAYDMGTPVQDPTLGLIKEFEGFRETPYWDVNAHRVGFGSDTITLPDGTVQRVAPGVSVSEADAERDLQRRVNTEFVPIVRRAIGDEAFASLNPNQRAALTSIAYNYGKLPGSVADAVRSGNVQSVTSAIQGLGSHNNGINAKRRAREAATFAGSAISAPQSGGVTTPMLLSMASDPRASDAQRGVLQMLLQQQMQANDPLRQMQMQKMQAEIDGIGKMTPYQQAQVQLQQQKLAGGGADEYGLTPQYGVDEAGNPVLIQLSKDGRAIQTPLPDGVTFQKEPIRVDAGTNWILLDPISRQPVGQIPKNLGAAESEKVQGRIAGENTANAQAQLSGMVAQADQSLALIDNIINDPALAGITGMFQGRLPPMSQAGTDLNVKIEQLKGKAFLEAFESLKGGGAITEREGAAASAAMARLDRAQSTEEFIASLRELSEIMRTGVERAREKAGSTPASQTGLQASGPDFSTMSKADVGMVDIGSLSDAQMDALEARMKELGL